MTNETRNVPELRFHGFENEWEEKKLGDIGKVSMNKRIYKSETSSHNDIPFFKISTFGKEADTYITKDKFEEYKQKYPYPNKGDILISASGSIGKTIEYNGEKAYYQDSNIVWLDHNNEVLNIFLKYFYLVINWSGVEGTTIKRLYNKNILNSIINFPSVKEQQKIGNFFSKLDQQIELEEQKLELLEQQKKGYMQKIFSKELRFKDKNDKCYSDWKEMTIKEVANLTTGKSKKNENTGKYIIMDMGTVTKNGTMLTHKSTPYENDLLNKGDLVMPKDDIGGGHIIGRTVFIPESNKYVLGDHVYRLEIKNCNSLFLHYYINSDVVNHSLKRKVTGSAQLGLNRKSVEEELIKIPSLEEQGKIGIFFNKIENLIELQTNKIVQLKQHKKGFLQKMFV
ncbi:restriction endonuclease subunit S [Staphylococcus devriesei]|uniref:Restriction endonuclease subunit S n=2 Tax=Staphylococcus devriesei TaxID=586733 RepID=A0A2K4DH09_9STAP|nr:restriction endonuclease subunit S [Staphylococcus devriesei]MCE5090849.1 restriction endonuclease subunit S [Staphylococcus devriesei]MCE5097219.1 restriction endonuclease subunit S [Staphylococcus devriesei]PNZ86122.1 restriction endonuclease subunit S [Staphylococcus devriesei]PTF13723.1 restriction endonuclease subunit S [Staphylococcus devriesei]PTF16552.1 restriction endonuclease subunit S [Staphylococcus devriesei]